MSVLCWQLLPQEVKSKLMILLENVSWAFWCKKHASKQYQRFNCFPCCSITGSWLTFNLLPVLSGAAPSSIAYPWWSTKSTARVHPANTRHPSGETPPGIECPQLLDHLYPGARLRRALIACSASRSSSSTRQPSHEAHPLIGSCQMGLGTLFFPVLPSTVPFNLKLNI